MSQNESVNSDAVVVAFRRLLQRLPQGLVNVVWLQDALTEMISELKGDSIVSSMDAIEYTQADGDLSLMDLVELLEPVESDTTIGLPAISEARYVPQEPLGSGGQGVVRKVKDLYLHRQVALKSLRAKLVGKPRAERSFLREARITGQLSHAGIIPIHDVGVLPDGAPCYSMRLVWGRSLRDILIDLREFRRHLRAGQPDPRREFTRRRLIEVLVSASHAVGYAHDRGVVHRDLKPANLMVGEYGEVMTLDWGVAMVTGKAAPSLKEGPVILEESSVETQQGVIKGTPGYMAPEQAYGARDAQGPASDVYALGLILHEVLSGMPVRRPGTAEEALDMARTMVIESPERVRLRECPSSDPIPEELEEICMKALERDPARRFPNGEALAKALEAYLDGERRRGLAEERAKQAELSADQLKGMDDAITRRRTEAQLLSEAIEPWADLAAKRMVWQKEDELRAAEEKREETLAEAFALFTQALGNDPENGRARKGLAHLYFEQLEEAEFWGRTKEARRFEAQVRRLDAEGLAEGLHGDGLLHMTSDPVGARVVLHQLVLQDRQLQPVSPVVLGETPVSTRLSMGEYLVDVVFGELEEGRTISYPVVMTRQGRWEGHVRDFGDLGDDFALIPAGLYIRGGDRRAPGSLPRERIWVDDVAIARLPVSCAEYLEFLNDVLDRDSEEAFRRRPRTSGRAGSEALWPLGRDERIRIPQVDIRSGRWSAVMAVRSISREDAEAFCRWKAERSGIPYRLPAEAEWEKSGRGVDGRFFPWGSIFDASFCKMKDSRPGKPEPEPIGAFNLDCSPYGVRDLAGGVIEWCSGPFDRHGLLGIQKGGFWLASEANCRLARRFGVFPVDPEPFGGFRLAYTPSRRKTSS